MRKTFKGGLERFTEGGAGWRNTGMKNVQNWNMEATDIIARSSLLFSLSLWFLVATVVIIAVFVMSTMVSTIYVVMCMCRIVWRHSGLVGVNLGSKSFLIGNLSEWFHTKMISIIECQNCSFRLTHIFYHSFTAVLVIDGVWTVLKGGNVSKVLIRLIPTLLP